MSIFFGGQDQTNTPFGFGSFGLSGFLNGQALGQQKNDGPSIGNPHGLKSLLQGNANLRNRFNTSLPVLENNREKDQPKQDRTELSDFARNAAEKALENAKQSPKLNGLTNQVFVSEDGRFEASIDLKINRDGSFDLDLAVKFAQSSAVGFQTVEQSTLPEDAQNHQPVQFNYNGMGAMAERYTAYEQVLETRGLQARIFFEESQSIAMQAGASHGNQMAERYLGVSQQVAQEFTLNIEISGESLEQFNEAAESMLQFDDTGTLAGFLDAAKHVLDTGSSNLDSFLQATLGLMDASREHVSAKVNHFFGGLQDQFGGILAEAGFSPDFLEKSGKDVQSGLDQFFKVSNHFFENLLNGMDQIQNEQNSQKQQFEILQENMEQIKEQREEKQNALDESEI